MKKMKQMAALVLTAALTVSGLGSLPTGVFAAGKTALTAQAADTVSGTAVSITKDKDGLFALIRANFLQNIDLATYGDFTIDDIERNRSSKDLLTIEAQNLKANADSTEMEYNLYDINRDGVPELFMFDPSGVRASVNVYRHDTYHMQVDLAGPLGSITEIHKKPKKKQIVVVSANDAFSFVITTYKLTDKGKLKKVVTYSKNKKVYKKNKKKITRKAFNKYYKSVVKLKSIKPKAIPTEDIPVTKQTGYAYYGKNYFYASETDDVGETMHVMKKGDAGAVGADKFLAYDFAYDLVGDGEYTSDPAITRYVFGPDTVNPASAQKKTFLQTDWESMVNQAFGREYECPFMIPAGDGSLAVEIDGLANLTVSDGTAKNGTKDIKTVDYRFETGDCVLVMSFFSEGELIGRAADVKMLFPQITGEFPYEEWTYTYGSEIPNEPTWDPAIGVCATGKGVETGLPEAKNRTLTIGAANEADKQTITVNHNVRFELYPDGETFYTYKADGTTKWVLPRNEAEDAKDFEDLLNPATGQLTYGEPKFDKGLFWDPTPAA